MFETMLPILVIILSLTVCWADAGDFEKRQASNTTASFVSSVTNLPIPSQAPTVNSSAYDLTKHYCRLWRHSSAYVNGSIYIDSGNTYTPQGNTTFNTTRPGEYDSGQNVNLLVIDLSKNFTENDTFPYRTINKPPGVPPALEDSALWYSAVTRKLYQLGGWFSRSGTPSTPGYIQQGSIPKAAIWEFDLDTELWSEPEDFQLVDTGKKIDRPGAAAHCDAPTLNQSFIFEGFVQQMFDPDYENYTLYDTYKFIEGMLRLDTSEPESPILTNILIPTFLRPRLDGSMIHVPIGEKGILVLIGGQTTSNLDTPWGQPVKHASGGNIMINMTEIDIYDIKSGYWFRQKTFDSGSGIPSGRGAMCLELIPAADGSSWNIIMVAGILTFDSKGSTSRQEIWALSLPTFQWVRLYGKDGGLYHHTCHLVGENLLIIGGMERTLPSGSGDATYCQSSMPARIFSMPLLNYTGTFDYPGSLRPALVLSAIVSVIGGTATGGALKTAPEEASDNYIQYIFNTRLERPVYTPPPTYILASTNETNATSSSTPTSTPTQSASIVPGSGSSSSNTGAIAGGVVGGVAGLAFIGFLLFCFIIRPRKRKSDEKRRSELPSYQESKDHPPVEIADRDAREGAHSPPVEMPIPGSPTPLGWNSDRVGEEGDNITPLVGARSENQNGDHWGQGHRRGDSDSRFSEVSNDSDNTAVRSGHGSPPVSPRIPRKNVGPSGA